MGIREEAGSNPRLNFCMEKIELTKERKYTGFGDTCEFAESLGWEDPNLDKDGEWTPDMADATEESALDFIRAKGYVIKY